MQSAMSLKQTITIQPMLIQLSDAKLRIKKKSTKQISLKKSCHENLQNHHQS